MTTERPCAWCREPIDPAARRDKLTCSKACRQAKHRTAARIRAYGITEEWYRQLLENQNGLCAICRKPPLTGHSLAIDHCHQTGVVRGLLCYSCNLGLGQLGDSVAGITAVLNYLTIHDPNISDLEGAQRRLHALFQAETPAAGDKRTPR